MTADLAAEGWSEATAVLCARAGPLCACGAYAWRTRREPTPARPLLVRVRCEGCGRRRLLDLADPAATLAEIGDAPAEAEQGVLF